MKPKVSFTIIAYNEEKNIANCINSILNQDGLKNYEIVIVNDASKDKTAEIVKEFSKRNKRIRLIDLKENKGRGNARFVAINNAKGEYIASIDADIMLPKHWLEVCLSKMKKYDAVGGTAIPDGDVAYIYKTFKLIPKVVAHTVETTGSNSMFKSIIFKKVKPNFNLRGGYDCDLNIRLKKAGFKAKSIEGLIVRHEEDVNFKGSIRRMNLFGEGATNLLFKMKKVRIADLAFFGFLFVVLSSILLSIFHNLLYGLILFLSYLLIASTLHLYTKFRLNKIWKFILAVFVNSFFLFIYYIGRIKGFFKKEKKDEKTK